MPQMVFAFLITLVNLAAVILILLIVIQAQNRAAKRRQEMFLKALESGVYDRKLLGKTKGGHALLGWGIFFLFVGFAIMIALRFAPDPFIWRSGMAGAIIPIFIGLAMVVFYFIVRALTRSREQNDRPVVLDEASHEVSSGISAHGLSKDEGAAHDAERGDTTAG
ncbi:MAG: hypothetical protein GF400_00065 [Candidatus Eisenbacteria bacterium]|nr:hypothetical protein [Candidatus Eisenbacteria bacterium]